jgi:hypothetical protein
MASTGMPGSGGATGPFMGVGSNAKGPSIIEPNGQTTYETWEFLYDPRIEQLKAKAGLNGAIGQAPGSSNMGTPGAASPFGSPTNAGPTNTLTTQP